MDVRSKTAPDGERAVPLHDANRAAQRVEIRQHLRPAGAGADGEDVAPLVEAHGPNLRSVDDQSAGRGSLATHRVARARDGDRSAGGTRLREEGEQRVFRSPGGYDVRLDGDRLEPTRVLGETRRRRGDRSPIS